MGLVRVLSACRVLKGGSQVEGAVVALMTILVPSQGTGGVGGSKKPLRERRPSCSRMRPERRGVLRGNVTAM